MAEEKERISGEVKRSEVQATLPTSSVPEKIEPPKASVHPAAYVVAWIGELPESWSILA
jgi:hypothetical protein